VSTCIPQDGDRPFAPEGLRTRFGRGATPHEFLASLPDSGARIAELQANVKVDRSASAFARLNDDLHVLGLAEGWCRDSQDGLAVLLSLAGGRPNVHIRIFKRDDHPCLMAAYRKDGQYDSIPVFVFLDGEFNEIGRYVERPDDVTSMYEQHRTELAAHNSAYSPADAPLQSFDPSVRRELRAAVAELRERDRPQALVAHAIDGTSQPIPQSPASGTAGDPAIATTQDDSCDLTASRDPAARSEGAES
jgi:hypothetical protein